MLHPKVRKYTIKIACININLPPEKIFLTFAEKASLKGWSPFHMILHPIEKFYTTTGCDSGDKYEMRI